MYTRSRDGDIAATYALVHRFLKEQAQHTAAQAVKIAAKPFVVLRDDMKQKGTPLEDIIKAWKTRADIDSGDTGLSSEDAESGGSSSGSDSSSEESEDASSSGSEGDDTTKSDNGSNDSVGKIIPEKPPQKPVERDTSVTLSSENTREVVGQAMKTPRKSTKDVHNASKSENKSTQSDSADSDSSGSDCSSQRSDSDDPDTESSLGDSSSSIGSNSSNKCEEDAGLRPLRNVRTTTTKRQSTSDSGSEPDDETDLESEQSEDTHAAKRRKTMEDEVAATTSATALQKKAKPIPKVKNRFQRVKIQDIAPKSLLNNGYEARGGKVNDYGERAYRDLATTRGAGFRKEKNKKKRGSYRGGEITMENHSIRFDF